MGEALITRRGGGKKITTATEVQTSWNSSSWEYTFPIESDGIYTVSLYDGGAYSAVIVNGEAIVGSPTIEGNTARIGVRDSLSDIKVYRLE